MKKIPIYFLLWTLPVVLLMACSSRNSSQSQSAKKTGISMVEGFVVKPMSLKQTISVSGTVRPFEETVLMPEMAGRVVMINLPEGKLIRQGTLLIKLFDDDLQAQLKKTMAQLELAQLNEKRNAELLQSNAISQSDYDQSALQMRSIQADIDLIKAQISKTEIKAPYDGILGLRMISPGAQVTPGTALATLRTTKRLKVDFNIPGKYSELVKSGLKVSLHVQGEDTTYRATVIATEGAIDVGTRNFKVRALIDNAPPVKPGSFANVDLELGENDKAIMIPTQAIIPRERDKQVILASGGKAHFTPVKTGVRQESLIEVLWGLHAGDTIVTTGILFMKPGAEVKFSKIAQ
jgi:membrane fusion protein (multidrug efflux system)